MKQFHIHSIVGNAWPPIPPGEVSQLWVMALELERTQWLSAAELADGQLRQLRSLLAHCEQEVPYYQDALRQTGMRAADMRSWDDWRRLPLLTRLTVQQQSERMLARRLPAGTQPTTSMHTSGTSGIPIAIRQTNLVNLWWFAFHLRDLAWIGVDLRRSLAVIRGLNHPRAPEGYRQEYWNEQFPRLLENGPSYVMDIHQEPRRQLQWLLRVQPDYLLSYPPNLDHLATLLTETGARLRHLKTILTLGETLTDDVRAHIETSFGVPVKNTYSCVEAGYLASPCPEGHGLHVHAENVLLEVLDDQGRPCAPGETGRVVLTTLHNSLFPLVRYEILDAATLGPACPCGRGLPLLTQVLGKRRPQFHLPDGRRKDSGYLVRQLRRVGGYHQHQIVQDAVDHVLVRLVPGPTWTDAHSAQIAQCLRDYFEAPIHVEVQLAPRLELTQAGKVRDVVVALVDKEHVV